MFRHLIKLIFSNKLPIVLCLSFFVFSPILVFADNSITTQNEGKIYVTVKPNNTIIVQSPDNTALNELVKQLPNVESKIIKGDILISSSTIIGLFGFGSFVAMRFRGSNIGRQGRLMELVYLSSFTIIVLNLLIIYSIVILDKIDPNWYAFVIVVSIFAVAVVAGSMIEITDLQVREAVEKARTVDRLHMVAERERRLEQEKLALEKTTSEETKKTNDAKTTKVKSTKGKTKGGEK